jgi:SAM-dependent methyltransferase
LDVDLNGERKDRSSLVPQPPKPAPPTDPEKEKARADWGEKANAIAAKYLTKSDSPPFNLTADEMGAGAIPTGDQFTPCYLLDPQYRIVDWNEAFAILFDNTMDGLRGRLVSDWVFYLQNANDVMSRAEDFKDEKALPNPHVDKFEFQTARFGKIKATKKAYKIPKPKSKEQEVLLGWTAVLDVEFENRVLKDAYSRELINALRWDLVWTEYAICYDAVLLKTKAYPNLIASLIGETKSTGEIPDDAKILDLGAGTGNVALALAEESKRRVLAVEKNRTSIGMMRAKLQQYLVADIETANGVQVVPQDIRRLRGLPEDFDVILLNNVLYTIDDPLLLLQQLRDHLTPGGELRITGPMKTTDLDQLFTTFRKQLIVSGDFPEFESHLELAYEINQRYLTKVLYKYSVEDVRAMIEKAGFKTFEPQIVYEGQAFLLCALKEEE